jgi:hypothetical protein
MRLAGQKLNRTSNWGNSLGDLGNPAGARIFMKSVTPLVRLTLRQASPTGLPADLTRAVFLTGLLIGLAGCTARPESQTSPPSSSNSADYPPDSNPDPAQIHLDVSDGETRRILARQVDPNNVYEWVFNVLGISTEERESFNFLWDLGDGTRQTGDMFRHTFAQTGLYSVSLQATDSTHTPAYLLSQMVAVGVDVDVSSGNFFVYFEASVDYSTAPPAIWARAATTALEAGETVAFEWTFSDGTFATGPETSHGLTGTDPFHVTVSATTSRGRTASYSQTFSPTGDDDASGSTDATIVADAGEDQTVAPGTVVLLDGSDSTYAGDSSVTFSWTQVAGPSVVLDNADQAQARCTAPDADHVLSLRFRLSLQAAEGTDTDETTIIVSPGLDPNDSDSDGLPDEWEVTHFGSPAGVTGSDDPDGDYFDNEAEWMLGTDPTDPGEPHANQVLLHHLDRAIRGFWQTAGRFEHARDGTLVGWPMIRTVDDVQPTLWGVDDSKVASQPLVSVMSPGMAEAGMTFLRAFEATGNKLYLQHALAAADTLLSIQRDFETTPEGALRPSLERGGWPNHAVLIPASVGTGSSLGPEIGHWTDVRPVPGSTDQLNYVSRLDAAMLFDDSISTGSAMFLLELYRAIEGREFSGDMVDPLAGVNRERYLEGASRFFDLAEAYRTNFTLTVSDFSSITITHDHPNKSGPHPFTAYLDQLDADHPLRQGQPYRPYATGGLPLRVEDKASALVHDATKYGARSAGKLLHKQVNDHVLSQFCVFLLRCYQVTGDPAPLQNLQTQLQWAVRVFQTHGNRGWCQQYHVLDDRCAAARPWEPPAFSMREGIYNILRLSFVEWVLENQYGLQEPGVQPMLEDAVFYIDRVVEYDEPGVSLFNYYAVNAYDQTTDPTGYPGISADDPVFSCDFYYPDDPYVGECGPPYQDHPASLYGIDEQANGEFVSPVPSWGLTDVPHNRFFAAIIADGCLDAASPSNYRGCLELDKQGTPERVWKTDRMYWGSQLTKSVEELLAGHRPDADGWWTSTKTLLGQPRVVVDTATFRFNLLGYVYTLGEVPTGILDADSDGLSDATEQTLGTDPHHPDSDGDGASDGNEILRFHTSPTDPGSHPD